MTDRDLTIALCEALGAVPGWHWDPAGTYPPSKVGIFYGPIPDKPDRAIGVRVYGGEDPQVYQPERSVQLLIRGARGAPDGADLLAGVAFVALQGLSRRGICHVARSYFGPLGADANGREERSENYQITLDNLEVSP